MTRLPNATLDFKAKSINGVKHQHTFYPAHNADVFHPVLLA